MNTTVAQNRNGKTLLILLGIIAAMVALVAATPRLYRAFCEATGFDGTTQRADRAPGAVPGQITVRFDANVQPGLPWRFEPVQTSVSIQPGAKTQIFYRAQNLSARSWTGQAVYNVSPDTVGKYFKKIQCFCFSEQTLKAGEDVKMPVIFFVDPELRKDPDTKDVHEITLSYTFYPVETETAGRLRAQQRTREAATHGRDEEPRLPSGRPRSVADHRRAVRRRAVQRRGDVVP